MNRLIKAFSLVSILLFLAACGESIKTIEPADGLFKISVSDQYQDIMDKKDAVVAVRLEGAPADNITLLQAKDGDIEKDIIYAVTIELPEGVEISLPDFEQVMNEQMNSIKEIVDFKVSPVKGHENQINYVAETNLNNSAYYEYCRIAVDKSITTICIGTIKDPKGAKSAIDSIEFAQAQ